MALSFTNDLKSAIDLFFPERSIRMHFTDKPWMTPALKNLIIERQNAFHSNNHALWRKYRNKVRNEITLKKRSYYSGKVQHLKKADPKKWWNYIKQITGSKRSPDTLSITKEGTTQTGLDLACLLNDFFVGVSADLPCLDLRTLPAYLPAPEPAPIITPTDVCSKLLLLKSSKSHGPDCIPNRVLKEFAYELSIPITTIFNLSLSTHVVPSVWKDAIITPIPKVHPTSSVDEFRPIALTPSLSKILEDFVVNWMIDDIKGKIDPQQFGSLKGSSCSLCLIDMLNNWLSTLDNSSSYLRVCFLDFSKAFDRINHNIVINKLLSLGVRQCLIPWISDFLLNRRQAVKVNGALSQWLSPNGGVPQGTKLGPVLFLVMINDLELKSNLSCLWKYVDDITLCESLRTNQPSSIQSDLDKIHQWAENNDMKLNPKKCKEMVVSFLRRTPVCEPLSINGKLLDSVFSFKVLGVTLNKQLKWDDNIDLIVKKASKRLYILRVLRRSGVPSADLLTIYFSLIRSTLEYACTVWHNSLPKYLSDKLELVQKRAFRTIYPNTHYKDALLIANCSRLHSRRNDLCVKTFEQMKDPSARLHHILPSTRASAHGRSLRNNNRLSLPKCKTERYKNSFIPAMCYKQ